MFSFGEREQKVRRRGEGVVNYLMKTYYPVKAEACPYLGVCPDALSFISKELVSCYVSNLLLEIEILQNDYCGYFLVNMETIFRITVHGVAVFLR